MRRVCVSISVDVTVPGTPDEEEARRVALRHVQRWLDAGLPAPEPGVLTTLPLPRKGRVANKL